MRLLSAIAMCLLAAPLAAQDIRYSNNMLSACLGAASNGDDKRACIGLAADRCIKATPDGQTTYGMGDCLSRELGFWDERLNRNYKLTQSEAKTMDAENAEISDNIPKLSDPLRDMQRAWIMFRDATCDLERVQWGGGSGGGPATVGCLMRMTGQQALVLEDLWVWE